MDTAVNVPADLAGIEQYLAEDYSGLLGEVGVVLKRFLWLPDDELLVESAYVVHTWCKEVAYCTPYLYINGETESGKTRNLEILSKVCRDPINGSGMTYPAMQRAIPQYVPTLLVDEIDTVYSGGRNYANEQKRYIFNSGYRRGGQCSCVEDRQVRWFDTFCCKVLAGIPNGNLPATVHNRCIPIAMQAKPEDVELEMFIEEHVDADPQIEHLLDRLWGFHQRFLGDLAALRVRPIKGLKDRQNEMCFPLLAIAATVDQEDELRGALTRLLRGSERRVTPEQHMFTRIAAAFEGRSKVFTEELLKALGPPWTNGRRLADYLDQFGIAPKDMRIGPRVGRGYEREMFDEVFRRHLERTDDEEER